MSPFPERTTETLLEWMGQCEKAVDFLDAFLWDTSRRRFQRMATMSDIALKHFWWPFTQHKRFPKEETTVIDSRNGPFIQSFKNFVTQDSHIPRKTDGELKPLFDACCSWWTQGVDNVQDFHLQTELVRAMAFGAGRFGHVIFPEVAHEPVTRLTQKLCQTIGPFSNLFKTKCV